MTDDDHVETGSVPAATEHQTFVPPVEHHAGAIEGDMNPFQAHGKDDDDAASVGDDSTEELHEKTILPNVVQIQKMSQEGYSKGVFEFARYLQSQRSVVEANLSYVEALDAVWSAATDLAGLLQLEHLPPPGTPAKP